MIVARWQIDARFGHKKEVIASIKEWHEEIGTKIGLAPEQVTLMTGSVGAKESTVISETTFESLSELDAAWEKLGNIEAHKKWSRDLEPYIVSGSHRWEIYRVL